MFSQKLLEFSFYAAGHNWTSWRDCYECADPRELPILVNEERWRVFVREYSLLRGLPAADRTNILKNLKSREISTLLIESQDGAGVDQIASASKEWNSKARRQTSLLSKVATLMRPDVFVPIDQFAKKGVLRPKGGTEGIYAAHLCAVRKINDGENGAQIEEFLKERTPPTSNVKAFRLRMLDVCLMQRGGRWRSVPLT